MIASMDRRDLERLGHHVVSRRVALGYRNRTDLADSLQFTVRTLADIEHGVRKASAGTYAILENKLGWAPGSIDTILAGGEPTETVPNCTGPRHRPGPGIRAAPDHPQRPVAGVHRGIAAGTTTPHHRPTRQTPRNLGRLGRWPRPARRLARTGLAAPLHAGRPPLRKSSLSLASGSSTFLTHTKQPLTQLTPRRLVRLLFLMLLDPAQVSELQLDTVQRLGLLQRVEERAGLPWRVAAGGDVVAMSVTFTFAAVAPATFVLQCL